MLAVDFTLGPSIHKNTYHVAILKNQLTRGINILFPEMKDELQSAFNDLVPSSDGNAFICLPFYSDLHSRIF